MSNKYEKLLEATAALSPEDIKINDLLRLADEADFRARAADRAGDSALANELNELSKDLKASAELSIKNKEKSNDKDSEEDDQDENNGKQDDKQQKQDKGDGQYPKPEEQEKKEEEEKKEDSKSTIQQNLSAVNGKNGSSSKSQGGINNPFQRPRPGRRNDGQPSQPPKDPTIDDLLQILQQTKSPKAHAGILAGLHEITNESLHEEINIHTASDEEYNDYINKAKELLRKAGGLKTPNSVKLKDANIDTAGLIAEVEEEETKLANDILRKAEAERREREAAEKKFKELATQEVPAQSSEAIADKIARMVKSIIPEATKYNQSTWAEFNRQAYSRGTLDRGRRVKTQQHKKALEIVFYIDVSGSWTSNWRATKASDVFQAALAKFVRSGAISIDVWYFSDDISRVRSEVQNQGTKAWTKILKNVKDRKAECQARGNIGPNVIIMTDDDMYSQARNAYGSGKSAQINGFLWWVVSANTDLNKIQYMLKGLTSSKETNISRLDF